MSGSESDYAWQLADPVGEALHSLRMSGTFYCRSVLTAPWGVELPPMKDCLMFHVLTRGSCWVELDDAERVYVGEGDLVLLPHGEGHDIKDVRESDVVNIFDLPRELVSPRYEILQYGGGGALTQVICGAVCVEDELAKRVVRMLPKVIVLRSHDVENAWLPGLIEMMAAEARQLRPGGDTIITRVSDLLVVQAIRKWLDRESSAQSGWLGALHDEQIGKAIAQIHRNPTEAWTVESMAQGVGMSRSAFAARFMELVGQSPVRYLRQWRFALARRWLEEGDMPLADIAERLDYQSEAAFCRAFKKDTGWTPGQVRRGLRDADLGSGVEEYPSKSDG